MSTGNTSRDEADLETFLARKSPISQSYDQLEPLEPPSNVDQRVIAIALAAAKPVAAAPLASRPGAPAGQGAVAGQTAVEAAGDPDDVGDQDAPPAPRPRWLVPAALAASVLVAVGVGIAMLGNAPTDPQDQGTLASVFAKRVRERLAAENAASDTAAVPAAGSSATMTEPLPPPPPVFEPEGPQVEDLDAAIVLIRKELVLANQIAAMKDEEGSAAAARQSLRATGPGAAPGGAGSGSELAPAADPASSGVIQPRERRLTKIIDLYDGGNPDLAADSLEIFLRDFEDDPVSQRILGIKP